jgi:hypothetical protein
MSARAAHVQPIIEADPRILDWIEDAKLSSTFNFIPTDPDQRSFMLELAGDDQ